MTIGISVRDGEEFGTLMDSETGEIFLEDCAVTVVKDVPGAGKMLSVLLAERHHVDKELHRLTKRKEKINHLMVEQMREGEKFEYEDRSYTYAGRYRRVKSYNGRTFSRALAQLEPSIEELLLIMEAANSFDREKLFKVRNELPDMYAAACKWEDTEPTVTGRVI